MRLRPIGPNHGATPGRCGYWRRTSADPGIWSSIARDGIVTVNVGKADMGQHVASAMAQIVADELGAPWSAMRVAWSAMTRNTMIRCSARTSRAVVDDDELRTAGSRAGTSALGGQGYFALAME